MKTAEVWEACDKYNLLRLGKYNPKILIKLFYIFCKRIGAL